MKLLMGIALGGLALLAPAQPVLEKQQLIAIVSCVNSKAKELGTPLPTVRSENVRVRYHLGKYSFVYPDGSKTYVDRDNELRLVLYGASDRTALIYDLFLTKEQSTKIEIGRSATFRKVHGKWKSGDNPGGIASDLYLRDLLNTLSQENATEVSIHSVDSNDAQVSCSVLHMD
jgi:hypothetical protein